MAGRGPSIGKRASSVWRLVDVKALLLWFLNLNNLFYLIPINRASLPQLKLLLGCFGFIQLVIIGCHSNSWIVVVPPKGAIFVSRFWNPFRLNLNGCSCIAEELAFLRFLRILFFCLVLKEAVAGLVIRGGSIINLVSSPILIVLLDVDLHCIDKCCC